MHEAKQQIFFNYINEFSILHIKLLEFFNNPEEEIQRISTSTTYLKSSLIEILLLCYPELKNEESLIMPIADSLYS